MAVIWGALIITALASPLLLWAASPKTALFTYLPFSFFCHQLPERSFTLLQHPLAVCHRCSGIYLGLFLGTLAAPLFLRISPRVRRACILSAAAFLAADALMPFTGFWVGFPLLRFLTGLAFGVTSAPLAVTGLDEILRTLCRVRYGRYAANLKGVVS